MHWTALNVQRSVHDSDSMTYYSAPSPGEWFNRKRQSAAAASTRTPIPIAYTNTGERRVSKCVIQTFEQRGTPYLSALSAAEDRARDRECIMLIYEPLKKSHHFLARKQPMPEDELAEKKAHTVLCCLSPKEIPKMICLWINRGVFRDAPYNNDDVCRNIRLRWGVALRHGQLLIFIRCLSSPFRRFLLFTFSQRHTSALRSLFFVESLILIKIKSHSDNHHSKQVERIASVNWKKRASEGEREIIRFGLRNSNSNWQLSMNRWRQPQR